MRERANQESKPDLVSLIAHNPEMFELPDELFVVDMALLIVGGYETTKNSMSGGILALFESPDERIKLS